MKFHRKTKKIFYDDQARFSCETEFIKSVDNWLEFKDTVAYPEGGGQDSDVGTITKDGVRIRFVAAKKIYCHSPRLLDFPDIQVDGIILHQVHPDDIEKIDLLQQGDVTTIEIDAKTRFENSLSHTASHLLYAAISEIRPDVISRTIGCHIKPGRARFDFFTNLRFTPDDIGKIQDLSSSLSCKNLDIFILRHNEVPDARIWCCADYKIPCGGTHISSTQPVGSLIVRRKSLGTSKERISCEFPYANDFSDSLDLLNISTKP